MTRKIILGLAFKVWSPSLFELDRHHGEEISTVAIHFAEDHRWWLSILMQTGRSHSRGPFRSRDEVVRLIAARIEAVAGWSA